ncbi:MAG: hypothetical protein AAGB12_15985 [Pseudomonadota bacterium]
MLPLKASDRERAETYGKFAEAPEQMWAGNEKSQDSADAPDPQLVADAILKLLTTEAKKRPFRTTVDGTGLNPVISSINTATEQAMKNIYQTYSMADLFQLQQNSTSSN